jgi:cysteine-rich repeat protein
MRSSCAWLVLGVGLSGLAACDAQDRSFDSEEAGVGQATGQDDANPDSDIEAGVPQDASGPTIEPAQDSGMASETEEETVTDDDNEPTNDDTAEAEPDASVEPTETEAEPDSGTGEETVTEPDYDAGPVAACGEDVDCDDYNLCNGEEVCSDGQCYSGELATNGTHCELAGAEGALLCLEGNCVASICGDALVDDRTSEQCDDGNPADGDGCEVGCTYSCTESSECDDSNVCNGDETCDTELHACRVGESADDATSCGENRECLEGRCLQVGCGNGVLESDLGEFCDDGNLEDHDGCDSDCTFTCEADEHCDDGDVCNGAETCNVEIYQCVAGEELSCDDGSDCTDNTCDPIGGCVYPLFDGDGDGHASQDLGACGDDCNDEDNTIYSGAAELCDNKDNNCNDDVDELAPTWYVDCDGDGYALLGAAGVQQCDQPGAPQECAGLGLVGSWTTTVPTGGYDDCYDANASARPRLTTEENAVAWSSAEETGRPIGDRYDYNCDGTEEKQYTRVNQSTTGACYTFVVIPTQPIAAQQVIIAPIYQECGNNNGWTGATAPACGTSAEFSRCTSVSGGTCERRTAISRTQTCR